MQLILLAAGVGSRLKKKTSKVPKCLVKVNGKSIIDYNLSFFANFENIIIATGFKNNLIYEKFKFLKKIKYVHNKNYRSTNMVESLMLTKKFLDKNKEIVVCYTDIIFDKNIYSNLNVGNDLILVKSNWLKYWKLRTGNKVWKDAEDLKVSKNKLLEIGSKINKNNLPKFQYMGIFKLKYKSFLKLFLFYKNIKNKKIDMTNFINLCLRNKIINLKVKKTEKFWLEIDNYKDVLIAEKLLKKRKLW